MSSLSGGAPAARTVGRYSIMREVGRGGMASVYLARQLDLDRLVALKELRAFQDFDVSVGRRFLREAQLAGSFSHPNIVTVHEYFEHLGVPHIAMEYLPRGSLRSYVGRVALPQIGGILEGLLAGLSHAERHHVVHRDIKPENVLVTEDGGVKIADFGIAKATHTLAQPTQLTASGSTVGTPSYIAPEQAMAAQLGPWTDLYSVGITAFELFVGRTPFGDSEEPMAIVLRQISEPVPPLTQVVQGVDSWVADWVGWLLAKDPIARPQTAGEAWNALEEVLIGLLGPRWRRGAQLFDGAATATTFAHPVGAAGVVPEDVRLATTVPPRGIPAVQPPVEPASRRARRRRLSVALMSSLAGLALALLALGGRFAARGTPSGSTAQDSAATVFQRQAAQTPTTAAASPGSVAPTARTRTQASGGRQHADVAPTPNAPLTAEVTTARKLAQAYERAAASGSDAALRSALLRTAHAYRGAAAAAAGGDRPGYTAAIVAARAGRQAVSTELARLQQTRQTPASPQPPPSPCAGDSVSDDPSDDSCGP